MRATAFMLVLSTALLSTAALADVPGLMSYQGTLTDDQGMALDTTVSMTFTIYTDSAGVSKLWQETQDNIEVTRGLFNVLLGRVIAVPDSVFDDPERWLGVQVGVDPELAPRQRIATVGYAFESAEADTADFARSAAATSDGDWIISGNNMYSAVPGSVGMGTSTPLANFHLHSDVNTELRIGHSDWKNTISFYRHGDPAGYIVKDDDTRQLRISAGDSTDHLTIVESDGYVGIGTVTPAANLHINSQGNTELRIEHDDVEGMLSFYRFGENAGYIIKDDDTRRLRISAGDSTDHMTIVEADGYVGIGTNTPAARLDVQGTMQVGVNADGHDVTFYGDLDGGRFFWDDSLMALRAGRDTDGTHWDPDSIGQHSAALGYNTKATKSYSMALGYNTTADAIGATATGGFTTAGAPYSTAMGLYSETGGDWATAIGDRATASGDASLALGRWVTADTTQAMVIGVGVEDINRLVNHSPNSLMVGFGVTEPTLFVGGRSHRVGIGTASPTAKLDVNGSVNADSVYKIGENTVLSVLGSKNTLVGVGAGENNTGNHNTAVGFCAGRDDQGWDNTFVGAVAGSLNADGVSNTFIGSWAGRVNTNGDFNTFIGAYSGRNNTLSSENTFLGSAAGFSNTIGAQNTCLGFSAGYSNVTGTGNVFIGNGAGWGETGSDKLFIENSGVSVALIWGDFSDREVVIDGNGTDNINNRTLFVDGDAGGTTGWYNDSDGHMKKEIRTIPEALQKVQELRGVNFKWKDAGKHTPGRQMGFVAQEAVKVIPEVVSGEDGHYAMQYGPITALLVEAIKEQQDIIENLQARIETLEAADRPR